MCSIQPIPCLVNYAGVTGREMHATTVFCNNLWHGGQHGIPSDSFLEIPQKFTLWTASLKTHRTFRETGLFEVMLLCDAKGCPVTRQCMLLFPRLCKLTPLAGWVMHLECCDVVLWVGEWVTRAVWFMSLLGANPTHMQRPDTHIRTAKLLT